MMESFHDVRFPTAISFGATGGPERRVEIVTMTSGQERRNLRQSRSRRRFDAGTGVRALDDLSEIVAFFEARRGAFHAFRFRDPFDHRSCGPGIEPSANDQTIGISDGEETRFQLTKAYGEGADAYLRDIVLPVAGSVSVAVNGFALDPNAFEVDVLMGEVSLAEPPAVNAVVSAGYLFDIAARFDAERLEISLSSFKAGQIPTIPIVEVFP
ncbi:phage distal tail protein, Rcc01695 family [Aliihoeflea sp. PC F10.4]